MAPLPPPKPIAGHDPLLARSAAARRTARPVTAPATQATRSASSTPAAGVTPDASAAAERQARLDRLAARTAKRTADDTDRNAAATHKMLAAPARRRHPAQRARNAAFGLSVMSASGLSAWFAISNPSPDTAMAGEVGSAVVVTGQTTGALATAAATTTVAATVAPAPSTTVAAAAAAATALTTQATVPLATTAPTTQPATTIATNTVVDGATFSNKWGNVQVEVTFAPDGSLVDVVALQTPDNRDKSIEINNYAVPRLTSEVLQAQTADVHTISGATYTSVDYRNSLQSAIDAARAAGITAIA